MSIVRTAPLAGTRSNAFRMAGALAVCSGLAAPIAASRAAPVITTRVLADSDSLTRPMGDRPSLRDGVVVFLGTANEPAPARQAVFMGPLDGSGPFVAAAWGSESSSSADAVPWESNGAWFLFFSNPVSFGGRAFFESFSTLNGSGIWRSDFVRADPLVPGLVRETFGIGTPSAGPQGFMAGRFFYDAAFNVEQIMTTGQALPGGGTSSSIASLFFSGVLEGWAQEDTTCVLAPRVTMPAPEFAFEGGLYSWESGVGPVRLIANFATPFPGHPGRDFDQFAGVDTDGQTASFVGHDFTGGTLSGVFTAPVDTDGAGPIATIALTGQASPFGLAYSGLGYTATDDGVMFFEASIGDPVVGTAAYAVLAAVDGQVYPVWRSGEVLHGRMMLDGRINHRAMDGRDLVMWARYEDASQPGGLGVMLLHVRVDAGCVADVTGDGEVDSGDLSVFVGAFLSGDAGVADVSGDGEVDSGDLSVFIVAFLAGC